MPVTNLTIYDIASYFLPGAVFLGFLALLPPTGLVADQLVNGVSIADSLLAVIFSILAYVVGTLIQSLFSMNWFEKTILGVLSTVSSIQMIGPGLKKIQRRTNLHVRDETPFESVLEKNFRKTSRFERDFLEKCEKYFNKEFIHEIKNEETFIRGRMNELRWFIVSELSNRPEQRAERFLIVQIYYRGLWGVFVLLTIVYSVYLSLVAVSCTTLNMFCIDGAQFVSLGMLNLIFAISAGAAYARWDEYGRIYANALIRDFYTAVLLPYSRSHSESHTHSDRLP